MSVTRSASGSTRMSASLPSLQHASQTVSNPSSGSASGSASAPGSASGTASALASDPLAPPPLTSVKGANESLFRLLD